MNKRLASLMAKAPQAIAGALYQQANEIIADSVTNYVPFDTGTLAGSAKVQMPVVSPSEISVTFGFGGNAAPYAIAVHENPRSGKTGGKSPSGKPYPHWARRGEWKYLESPLKLRAPNVANELRVALDALAADRDYHTGQVNVREDVE